MTSNTNRESMEPIIPRISFTNCPIRESLGVLGRKWSLLVLRDIGFLKMDRFNMILKNNAGLTPRVLSMRLRDLEREKLIERAANQHDREIHYQLTRKGQDALPILTAFINYGMVYRAERVFADKRPRTLNQVFPDKQKPLLGELIAYAKAQR